MCERYVIPEQSDVEPEFRVAQPWWTFAPSFNAAPGRNVPVVRMYAGASEGVMLRWGLIPEWAEGDSAKACAAQVAAEHAARSTIAAGAWSRAQRCIVPAFGFYVWRLTPERYRQPYFVRVVNRPVFGVAALWDRTVREDDDVIESCAIITVPANTLLSEVNGARMPAIVHREDYETWLTGSPDLAREVLAPYKDADMLAHAVSPRINSLKYDDPGLIEPIEQRSGRLARASA